jgi:hypothetical protein
VRTWGLAGALLLCSAPVLAATPPPLTSAAENDAFVHYVAKRGDNLYTLAKVYMVRLAFYAQVQALNHVKDPRRIPIGTNLLIPRVLLKSRPLEAKVVAFRGPTTLNGAQIGIGSIIGEGGRLQTGANAFLSMSLADGTTITLPSQTSVRVERLRRYLITNEMERVFRVDDGRAQTQVTPRINAHDRFQMRTPISVAAVRGTDFRVAVLDGGKAASSEVLGGHVGLSGDKGEATLDAGVGAKVSEAGVTPPIPLLPEPALVDAARVQDDEPLHFRLQPVTGAIRYRVQVAADAGFLNLIEERLSDRPDATLPGLADGDYFVRLTAIDTNELEGKPRVYGFHRALNVLSASATELPGRRYLFKWRAAGEGGRRYRLVLARAAAPDRPVIDEPGLTSDSFVATGLPAGDYVWHVQMTTIEGGAVRSTATDPQTLTVAGGAGQR